MHLLGQMQVGLVWEGSIKRGTLYSGPSINFMGINGSSLHNSLYAVYAGIRLCVIVSTWSALGLLSRQSVFQGYYWTHSETGGYIISPRARSVAFSCISLG
jgi:hypothetical protein